MKQPYINSRIFASSLPASIKPFHAKEIGVLFFRILTDIEVFKAGETIFNEGVTGNEMFVIQEGEVDIWPHDSVIDTIGAGMPLGEMGLIDGQPRSASAIAKTDCKLVRKVCKKCELITSRRSKEVKRGEGIELDY